jgi:hypothetical protein
MIPAWVPDSAAGLVLAAAALSGARLLLTRPPRDGTEVADAVAGVAYLLTGTAIAGVLAAGLRVLPRGEWEAVFALLTAWFAVQVARDARTKAARIAPESLGLLVLNAGMLYVFGALATTTSAGTGMAAMAAAQAGQVTQTLQYPTLAFVFGLVLVGYTIWYLDRASGERGDLAGASRLAEGSSVRVRAILLSSSLAACCQTAIFLTISFTLFTTAW